ncbi:MAG: Na+ dependent nucleoside transporter N-terminal domain-containing protein, partial [Bacteroidota bacterium]
MTLLIGIALFCTSLVQSQYLNGKWSFESNIETNVASGVFTGPTSGVLELNKGIFSYTTANGSSFKGDYIHQNNLLVFFYDAPRDTMVKYSISAFTDSTLAISNQNMEMGTAIRVIDKNQPTVTDGLIPSNGFSVNSLWRGVLGMLILIFIAFLFSSNKKAIDWKVVGLGLGFQVLIAIGVLKVNFIKYIFESVGKVFVSILDFTRQGSQFLFEGLVSDMDTFGFIFAFQVLPTIVFFSALTSVLFYTGIIQKLVYALGWLLTKILRISGAESLSVAGNIFLGQTEAPLLIKAYLEKMNKSEILLVMIGGMATVAGAVLAAYIGFLGGDDPALRLQFAKHLLAASVMAAPGAIVISQILYPQTESIT